MKISDKEKTNRSSENHGNKGTKEKISQNMREAFSEQSPTWEPQKQAHKHHGDKEASEGKSPPANSSQAEDEILEESDTNDANAEYIDHQEINETNDDDFDQPQSMSEGLSSIYPGRASTREEREALARERQQKMNAPENQKPYGGTPSSKHTEYRENVRQGKLGKARGEVPSGHRDPNFSPARQNFWGDEIEDDRYGDHDYDDSKVRRKQDQGARPWDTASDVSEERRTYNKRRQKEDEFARHSYKRKDSARHGERQRHATGRGDDE